MDTINIGSRREVCWDEMLIDTADGVEVQMHRPQYKGVALELDELWEGNGSGGYGCVLQENSTIRLYYRGLVFPSMTKGRIIPGNTAVWCLAESKDGKHFHRVPLEMERYAGRIDNNIIPLPEDARKKGSQYIFRDTNPACPSDEQYKALVELPDQTLCYFKSADGVAFERVRVLADDGAYDSLNVAFWDPQYQKYFLFYRGIHGAATENGKWTYETDNAAHNDGIVRDIRVRTSTDFVNWDEPQQIAFDPERDDVDLYINNIQKYYRADHMFVGFPVRYQDRYLDGKQNYLQLPGLENRSWLYQNRLPRIGTVITDALVMTSRDGYSFRRTEEAFLTPGIESMDNWVYGDGYFYYGMVETPSDIPGAPNEISMYAGRGYLSENSRLCRYVSRLDGFFSWHSDYAGGKVLTKPFTFTGNTMKINFATSGAGYVQFRLTDAAGNFLVGYDSGKVFGDSVDRTVFFSKPLNELCDREIRMEISMKDADLYSFKFEESVFI